MDGQNASRLRQIAASGVSRARHIGRNILTHVNENRLPYATAAVATALLGIANAPHSEGLLGFADHMISGAINLPVWAPVQEQGFFEMLSSPGGRTALAGTLAADVSMGGIAQLVGMSVQKNRRMEKIREGIEPLHSKEKPTAVLIGPSEIISDIAISKGIPKDKKKPIIGIHIDNETPSALGQEMAYHFRANNISEITGRHAPSTKKQLLFIEAAGLDRADEITFVCTNPDNALFYGMRSAAQVDPYTITTVINKIAEKNPSALKGKRINAIIGNTPELGGSVGIRKDFDEMAKKLGIEHKIIIPEEVVMDMIKKQVEIVAAGKGLAEAINITLVGQGNTEDDKYMLEEFKKALSAMDNVKDVAKERIHISLVDRLSVNDYIGNADAGKEEEKIQRELTQVLGESDLILAYGDKDTGTSSLVNLMVSMGIEKEKIHALIERPGQVFDVLNERALGKDNVHCIYDMVMNEFKSS